MINQIKQTLNIISTFSDRSFVKIYAFFAFFAGFIMLSAFSVPDVLASDKEGIRDAVPYQYPYSAQQTLKFSHTDPLVVELFTSVNCVYCPGADRLLKDLRDKTSIIALTCHVDYYDISDNALSREFCSQRQFSYSENVPGASIFTPQIIMNGTHSAIGYKYNQVLKTALKAGQNTPARIEIVHKASTAGLPETDQIAITLPETLTENIPADEHVFIWVGEYQKQTTARIPHKNVNTKQITYANVVTNARQIQWDGKSHNIHTTVPRKSPGQGLVVFAQKEGGRILAAGMLEWPMGGELN